MLGFFLKAINMIKFLKEQKPVHCECYWFVPTPQFMNTWNCLQNLFYTSSQNVKLSVPCRGHLVGTMYTLYIALDTWSWLKQNYWKLAIGCEPKVLCILCNVTWIVYRFYVKLGWNWNRVVNILWPSVKGMSDLKNNRILWKTLTTKGCTGNWQKGT
jgi:hypothetical protein